MNLRLTTCLGIVAYFLLLQLVAYGALHDEEGIGGGDTTAAIVLIVLWLAASVLVGSVVHRAWVLLIPVAAIAGFMVLGPSSPAYYDNEYWPANLVLVLMVTWLSMAPGFIVAGVHRKRTARRDPHHPRATTATAMSADPAHSLVCGGRW